MIKSIFKKVSIKMASSSKILSWSFGEVTHSNFINFKNLKPEPNGLFCLKIFSDFELCCLKKKCFCHSDKFLNLKKAHTGYKVGHIKLFYPAVHIWYIKSSHSNISNILNLSYKILEKIINFKLKVVIKSYDIKIKKFNLFIFDKKIKNIIFTLSGAKALKKLLSDRELFIDCLILKIKIKKCNSFSKLFSILKHINKILIFYYSGNKPSWMILKKIPVLPPRMRPLIALSEKKFASSDINELYKIVLERNYKLKKMTTYLDPKQLLINERISLQESIYALFDNEKLINPILTSSKRVLKSFSSLIKGKYGRFRQNLLGKRVDFSGRTVITVEPNLFLYECKIPIYIALELFKPILYYELKKKKIITTISFIDDYYKKNKKQIILLLKNKVKSYFIMLNRAPTLHRMNFQSFKILLTEDKTIKIHPLVCLSYNADFDGDQMAIHLPLTNNAKVESNYLLLSINNIISPSNGNAIIIPTQDIIMGIYYFTFDFKNKSISLNDINDIINFFEFNNYNFQINIKFNNKKKINTTLGRIIINYLFFKNFDYFLNMVFKKKILTYLIKYLFDFNQLSKIIIILEKLKKIGFLISTYSGITISYFDLIEVKNTFLINKVVFKLKYNNNIFSIVELLNNFFVKIIIKKIQINKTGLKKTNNLFIMLDSGSRGSMLQIKQLIAFRGFFSKSNGDIIKDPIFDNLKNGLNMKNYFISTFGARKGLTDTSLKTANSGYLTRKLIDVSHDLVVYKIDCKTKTGIKIFLNSYFTLVELYKNLYGRLLLFSVSLKNKILLKENTLIDNKVLFLLIKKKINTIFVRSVLFCISNRGVCCFCYGIDLSTNKIVLIGVSVGIISAQSIGEPGTQLTMRTFHTGGVASYFFYSDNLIISNSGFVKFKKCKCVINKFGEVIIVSLYGEFMIFNKIILEKYKFYYGTKIKFRNGFLIKKNTKLINFNDNNFYIYSENIGYVYFKKENNIVKNYCLEDNKFYYKTLKNFKITIINKSIKKNYFIPKNFNIVVYCYDYIFPGEIIAKLVSVNILKSSIIGGLPRLSELFEARIPKLKALLSEIDGVCKIKFSHLNYIITIISKFGFYKEYTLSCLRKLYINNGDYVKIGDILSDGKPDLNEIINLISINYLLSYFVNEINSIYFPQNIYVNCKHIELILKQMTKKVKIIFSGESSCQQGDILFLEDAINENFSTLVNSRRLSYYKRIVTGITKTSLESLSFFSAASFQETNKILVNSAIKNRTDYLLGLKENVLVGRLIPAGTGLIKYFKKKSKSSKNNLDFKNRKKNFYINCF